MTKKIPRYVLSITDTRTTVPGPQGDQHYAISVASNVFEDLVGEIPAEEDAKYEIQRVFFQFYKTVKQLETERPKKSIK